MSPIVLLPGVKMLLACKDFLQSEEWYAALGIPFRRGCLLHGVPGSVQTSLIHSLAATTVPTSTERKAEESDGSTLSLSGLLNALDSVSAAVGRLLFATMNHIERLDHALARPGRIDVWVNFSHATKYQAEGIFKFFFPCKKEVVKRKDGTVVIMHADGNEQGVSEKGKVEAANGNVEEKNGSDMATKNVSGGPSKRRFAHRIPVLSETEIAAKLAKYGHPIPEDNSASLRSKDIYSRTRLVPRETRAKLKAEKEKTEKEEKELAEKEKIEKEKEKEDKEREAKEAKEKEADNEDSVTSEEENGKKAKKEKWVSVKKEKDSGVDATPATEEKDIEVQATQSVEVSE
ncbi:hypothetical protein CYLTODRAFT_446948 [Cylindrobasidium torrendii FP15055 ss-10]|uniref:Uncharacterized protein n=1 Tax=Cylindrobasidium torrendii FP15055 ss-10 TaxID=1314674 RepID=A0A0D7AWZ1_9AGAR|nr:hypothetical protein CYLTODRAFT_446948 [Cylindrobasidium torrendii FP15055 ss-10]